MKRFLGSLSIISLAAVVGACSDSVAPPRAATVLANSFAYQQAFAGMPVGLDPEVLVLDGNHSPIAGITVKFTVTAGDGSVANASTVSGPQGRATSGKWTLGPSLGVNTVVARVDEVGTVEFKADAVPVPTGTFELATIDGKGLPYVEAIGPSVLIGGKFVLDASRSYALSFQTMNIAGGPIEESETMGSFFPKAPKGLSFYIDEWPWIDGTIDGDVLLVNFWDESDNLHAYEFIRDRSSELTR